MIYFSQNESLDFVSMLLHWKHYKKKIFVVSIKRRSEYHKKQHNLLFIWACEYVSTHCLSHHGDTEDVSSSAAVALSLSHPAELSRHVAEPVDRFVGVALDNRQDLIVLLFGHIQQLGNFLQLHMQLSNTGTLWRREEELSDELLCVKMSQTQAVRVVVLHL